MMVFTCSKTEVPILQGRKQLCSTDCDEADYDKAAAAFNIPRNVKKWHI